MTHEHDVVGACQRFSHDHVAMPASTSLRLSQVAFSGLSCLLTAGLIFGMLLSFGSDDKLICQSGFAALKPVLIHEDVYGDLCPNDAARDAARQSGRPCVEQDLQASQKIDLCGEGADLVITQLNLSFTISVVLTNVAALPIGVLLDNVGPRTTSIAGAILFALGNFTLGFQRGEGLGRILDPFLTGYILLAIGGPMIFLSSFHLCNTFPKVRMTRSRPHNLTYRPQRSGLILSSIIGAFDASSLPFVVYAALYKKSGHTIHLRQWFWLYTLIPAVSVCRKRIASMLRFLQNNRIPNILWLSQAVHARQQRKVRDRRDRSSAGRSACLR